MKRKIRENVRPVLAILGLFVIAAVVSGYILANQRLRFPFVEEQPKAMWVELTDAQAVTPGQGQTVQVGGVQIGSISSVELKNGRARVGIDVEQRYADLVKTDSKVLLRPRTGLKDMYLQVFPGKARTAPEGFVIPSVNTMPDVDLDEILATLDARTRDYLLLLVHGARDGLKGNGDELARVFERFEPTARDLALVSGAVARNQRAVRRSVTSLKRLNERLARRPEDLARIVDRSEAVFSAFAAEDEGVRDTLEELPDTLRRTSATLQKLQPFAEELPRATRALRPAVRELDQANEELLPFADQVLPDVRDQLRPFAREARPLVRDLAPAARDLNATSQTTTRAIREFNRILNLFAYNPNGREPASKAGREEGYLFWLAWTFHNGINVFNVDDANGPLRPIFLTGTCGTLTSIATARPELEFGLNLSPALAGLCGNPTTPSLDLSEALKILDPTGVLTPAQRARYARKLGREMGGAR